MNLLSQLHKVINHKFISFSYLANFMVTNFIIAHKKWIEPNTFTWIDIKSKMSPPFRVVDSKEIMSCCWMPWS